MYCVRCGRPGNPRRRTCAHCGTRLIDPDTLKPYRPIPKSDAVLKPKPDDQVPKADGEAALNKPNHSRNAAPLFENPFQPGRSVFDVHKDDSLYVKEERPAKRTLPKKAVRTEEKGHSKKATHRKKGKIAIPRASEKDLLRFVSAFAGKWMEKAKKYAQSAEKTVLGAAGRAGEQSKKWARQADSLLNELKKRISAVSKPQAKPIKKIGKRKLDQVPHPAAIQSKKKPAKRDLKPSAAKISGNAALKKQETAEIRFPSFMEEAEKRRQNAGKPMKKVRTASEKTGVKTRSREMAVPFEGGKVRPKRETLPVKERRSGKQADIRPKRRAESAKIPEHKPKNGRKPQGNRAYSAKYQESFVEKHLRSVIAMTLLTVSLLAIFIWCVGSTPGKRLFAQLGIGGFEGYIMLGDDCMEDGNYARAVEYYYKAIAKKTDYAVSSRLASAYRGTNDVEREASALLLCIDKFPNEKDPYYRLREIFPQASSRPEAVQEALDKGAERLNDITLAE